MAALTPEQADGVLKQRYPSRKVQYIGYKNNAFLALVPKDTSFDGDVYKIPLHFGGNTGGSRDFTSAKSAKSGGEYGAFLLQRASDYALGSIRTEAILASMSDVGAFLRLTTSEVDNTIRNASHNLNIGLYGNVGGARAVVGSVVERVPSSSDKKGIKLATPSDIVTFEKAMTVVSAATDGTSGSCGSHPLKIAAIDRSKGILYFDTAVDADGEFNPGDFLFRNGDFGLSTAGLSAWIPDTAPTSSDSFFTQNRSADVTRLAGLRIDGSKQTLEDCLYDATVALSVEGGNPSHCMVNPLDLGALSKSLGSKVVYNKVEAKGMASVGFRSITINGATGDVAVVADRDCPLGKAYMLTMDEWVLASLGPAPRFLMAMGQNEVIWDQDADSVEFRAGYYAQLGCYAPGHNAVITLPSS